jgi:hypothetical protein
VEYIFEPTRKQARTWAGPSAPQSTRTTCVACTMTTNSCAKRAPICVIRRLIVTGSNGTGGRHLLNLLSGPIRKAFEFPRGWRESGSNAHRVNFQRLALPSKRLVGAIGFEPSPARPFKHLRDWGGNQKTATEANGTITGHELGHCPTEASQKSGENGEEYRHFGHAVLSEP